MSDPQQPPKRKICPIGNYLARAISHDFGTNTKENTFVRIKFQTKGGEEVYMPSGDFFFTEKTMDRTKEDLIRCGWDGKSSLTELKGFGSTDVEISVIHEEYTPKDGPPKTVARVQWINSLSGLKNKASASELRNLDMLLGLARSSSKGNSTSVSKEPDMDFNEDTGEFNTFGGAPPGDDDIPF